MSETDSKQEESDAVRKLFKFIAGTVLTVALACPALAADVTTEQEAAAAYLREAGIMLGNEFKSKRFLSSCNVRKSIDIAGFFNGHRFVSLRKIVELFVMELNFC